MFKRIVFILGSLYLSGCSKEPKIEVYSIPKEASKAMVPGQPPVPPPSPQPSMAGGVNITSAETETPTWSAPASWTEQPLGSLKKGAWDISIPSAGRAEVSALVFPGDVGGDFKNVNRWRQQAGLEPWDQATFNSHKQPITVDGYAGIRVLLESPDSEQAILGAIVPVGSNTWYFKMMGDRSVVLKQQDAFAAFLSSVSFKN